MKSSKEEYPSSFIKTIFPGYDEDGKIESSVSKLIKMLYRSVGYGSQEKFVEDLCSEGMEPESVKKKINRWKSGKNSINVTKFMSLFFSKNRTGLSEYYLPEEIVYISVVLDQVYNDCRSLGLTDNEVFEELGAYTRYITIDFKTHG